MGKYYTEIKYKISDTQPPSNLAFFYNIISEIFGLLLPKIGTIQFYLVFSLYLFIIAVIVHHFKEKNSEEAKKKEKKLKV